MVTHREISCRSGEMATSYRPQTIEYPGAGLALALSIPFSAHGQINLQMHQQNFCFHFEQSCGTT